MNYNDNNPMSYGARSEAVGYDAGLRAYMLGIYNYMCSALVLTGISAYAASHWAPLMNLMYTMKDGHLGFTGFGLLTMFAPFALVLFIGMGGINKLSLAGAQAWFWIYAALNGLSLSIFFLAYTGESIVRVFFITAILFGSMGIWGYSTKRDLTSMGHFMMMGVWGIIIASVINIFIGSSALMFATSVIGVVAFTGLTAYDTQALKALYYQTSGNAEAVGKTSIMGALQLYLDFINLFIMLLRLMGDRRN